MTRHLTLSLFVAIAILFSAGCTAVPDKAIETVETVAAGNDRYTALVTQALAGTVDPKMGLKPVKLEELQKTPASVRLLIRRLLEALHTNRFAAHSVLYQLNKGPDPANTLKPVELPAIKDDDDLLGDD